MKAKDYQLIPMNDIDPEARELSVLWVESDVKEMNWIGDKHKLASDFMNYAKVKNKEMIEALKLAKQTIRAHHGMGMSRNQEMTMWNIYESNSPEMTKINKALKNK